mgnify:CR=1 FL=1
MPVKVLLANTTLRKVAVLSVPFDVSTISTRSIDPSLLRNVLQSSQSVQVKSMLTAQPSAIRLPGQQESEPAVLYQHKTTLVISGSYADLLKVVQQMEQIPWLLNWAELQYQVIAYPKAELALTLITVSEYEDFIRL